jgi:hypothetical protein
MRGSILTEDKKKLLVEKVESFRKEGTTASVAFTKVNTYDDFRGLTQQQIGSQYYNYRNKVTAIMDTPVVKENYQLCVPDMTSQKVLQPIKVFENSVVFLHNNEFLIFERC